MTRLLLALTLAAALAAGCHSGTNPRPPLPGVTPEQTLDNFRRDLWHDAYEQAYGELCAVTRSRYSAGRWKMFMSKTKVGALLEKVFFDWYLYNVRYSSDNLQAYLVFVDPKHAEGSKEFKMVQEDGKWKLWFSFAELFGMPDEDETTLGQGKPEPEKKAETEDKDKKGK